MLEISVLVLIEFNIGRNALMYDRPLQPAIPEAVRERLFSRIISLLRPVIAGNLSKKRRLAASNRCPGRIAVFPHGLADILIDLLLLLQGQDREQVFRLRQAVINFTDQQKTQVPGGKK